MAVTVRDIAKRLNIGKTTVGYALNGGPRVVSEELRLKVLQTAKEMGYLPNETARALAKGRTNMIGVVPFQLQVGALNSPFIRVALSAMYDAAETLGKHIVLFSGYDPRDPEHTRDKLFGARVDGVVIIAPLIDRVMLQYIADQNVPLAVIDSPVKGPGVHFNGDGRRGVKEAAEHLATLGHRRIATICGPIDSDASKLRLSTFRHGLRKSGVPLPQQSIQFGDFSIESGRELGRRLLQAEPRPTAVFTHNDQMACGLLLAARDLGLSVPGDLSIVGFDDDELSAFLTPPLTTVYNPIAKTAEAALRAVVRLADGKPASGAVFPTRLVIRESTAAQSGT